MNMRTAGGVAPWGAGTAVLRAAGLLALAVVVAAGGGAVLAQVPPVAQLPQAVRIASFTNAEPLVRPMERVVLKAYERLGIKATVVRVPIARSLMDADEGQYDAELGRTQFSEKEVKNLIRLSEPIGEIRYTPFVLRSTKARFKDWEALKQSGLHIGARYGTRVPEAMLGTALSERPNTTQALFKMLVARHVDVAVGTSNTMRATLAKMRDDGVTGVDDVLELQALDVQPMYHFLHKRHAALIKPLNAEFRKMQQDGSLQKIWEAAAKEEL